MWVLKWVVWEGAAPALQISCRVSLSLGSYPVGGLASLGSARMDEWVKWCKKGKCKWVSLALQLPGSCRGGDVETPKKIRTIHNKHTQYKN